MSVPWPLAVFLIPLPLPTVFVGFVPLWNDFFIYNFILENLL